MVKQILFVEDEQWLMEGIVDGLEASGYKVIRAEDGTEGLDLLESEHVDLILLDIMMPSGERIEENTFGRRTGVEFCKIARKLKPQVPIVCLTVVTDREIHNELEELGVKYILEKPTSPGEIVEVIERLTARHSSSH